MVKPRICDQVKSDHNTSLPVCSNGFHFAHGGGLVCENMSSDVTLGVSMEMPSFNHDIVPGCPWPSSSHSSGETGDRIAS